MRVAGMGRERFSKIDPKEEKQRNSESGIMLVWIGNWLGEALVNFIGLNDNQQILEEKH
jgi:hypothetical protein